MSRSLPIRLLVLTLSLGACQLDRPEEPIIIPLVDTEFRLDLWENLSPDGRTLEIRLMTISDEPCLNTQVSSEYQQAGRLIELNIKDIVEPETCDPGYGPAKGHELLTGATSGVYDLRIDLQEVVTNDGQLTVAGSYFSVEMESENGLQWMHDELRRVPSDAVWGYVHHTGGDQAAYAQQLTNALAENSEALPRTDGYYGHYTLSNGGNKVAVPGMPTEGEVRSFLYRLPNDPEALTALVDNWRAQAPAGMTARVFDSYGREY